MGQLQQTGGRLEGRVPANLVGAGAQFSWEAADWFWWDSGDPVQMFDLVPIFLFLLFSRNQQQQQDVRSVLLTWSQLILFTLWTFQSRWMFCVRESDLWFCSWIWQQMDVTQIPQFGETRTDLIRFMVKINKMLIRSFLMKHGTFYFIDHPEPEPLLND